MKVASANAVELAAPYAWLNALTAKEARKTVGENTVGNVKTVYEPRPGGDAGISSRSAWVRSGCAKACSSSKTVVASSKVAE